jgi:riboflavin synthase
MFTGIITDLGTIRSVLRKGNGVELTVSAHVSAGELKIGDSISVNGACQTVVRKTKTQFTVEAVEETVSKTTLGLFREGTRVNLELALRVGDRLGGHMVQGHVDCLGEVVGVEALPSSTIIAITFPVHFRKYVVPVGSICVDGISLTVARTTDRAFEISIIPHTLGNTTIAGWEVGRKVNLEFDVIGKYIEQLLKHPSPSAPGPGLSEETLRSWGF